VIMVLRAVQRNLPCALFGTSTPIASIVARSTRPILAILPANMSPSASPRGAGPYTSPLMINVIIRITDFSVEVW